MISRDSIESAYSFFHQKQRIYQYSTLDWQRDDIEYAIADYADNMNPELYNLLATGRTDFLRTHVSFAEDIAKAVSVLEKMLWPDAK